MGDVGGSVLANLRAGGFDGRIVAVNAARASVQGLAARRSLLEVEEPVDLAVVAVPAAGVPAVLEQCVARSIPAAIVISAGFREAGAESREREAKLRAWLAGQPLRVQGPNCLGWIRPAAGLNLTFAPGIPPRGGLGFVSHSGALLTAILDWSRERALGFSLLASLGNQADVTETDVLAAFADDDETRVILGYVEGVADGRAFFEALGAAAARKPCVLLTGRSAEGARDAGLEMAALDGAVRARLAGMLPAHAALTNPVDLIGDADPERYGAALHALGERPPSSPSSPAGRACARARRRWTPALEGARGLPAADLDALADTISRFSWLAAGADALAETEADIDLLAVYLSTRP